MKKLRSELGFTMEAAAAMLGMSDKTYRKYERYGDPKTLRDFRAIIAGYKALDEMPEISFSDYTASGATVTISGVSFQANRMEIYEYHKFRGLTMRYARILLPPMRQQSWLDYLEQRYSQHEPI